MKIIFLDFDGPLSNDRTQAQTGDWWSFDPVACQALNNICEASGTKVVISSTRAQLNSSSYRENCRLLSDAGFNPKNLHSDWCIRDKDQYSKSGHTRRRGILINKWLNNHPDISHYCIIDDENVSLPNFVKVSGKDGILSKDFVKISKFLDIDLSAIFLDARQRNGHDYETQYHLPFGPFQSDWNKAIQEDLFP